MMNVQFLEDLEPGQTYQTNRVTISAEQIKAFAGEFDPQPFHTDEMAAKDTLFQGLAASGWHTAAITMRLIVEGEFRPAGGVVGAGVEELNWPRPVRPGDTLRVESEVLEVRTSKSKSGRGIVKARCTTFNQKNEPVQIYVVNLVVQCRDVGSHT